VIEVDLGRGRNEDTREMANYYATITKVREALRRVEPAGTAGGIGAVEDR
jgi:hypothetical protein